MRLPKRGERGFTLIELLIVVAILGVLAAVVIPNVGRFIGRGETEAAETELANIQSAVISMMTDQGVSTLPTANLRNGTANATSNMNSFPINNSGNTSTEYVLYSYNGTINYVVTPLTKGTYYCDAYGTVYQYQTGY